MGDSICASIAWQGAGRHEPRLGKLSRSELFRERGKAVFRRCVDFFRRRGYYRSTPGSIARSRKSGLSFGRSSWRATKVDSDLKS